MTAASRASVQKPAYEAHHPLGEAPAVQASDQAGLMKYFTVSEDDLKEDDKEEGIIESDDEDVDLSGLDFDGLVSRLMVMTL